MVRLACAPDLYAKGEWSKAPAVIWDSKGRKHLCFSDGTIVRFDAADRYELVEK